MPSKKDAATLVARVIKDVDEDLKTHKLFADKADRCHRADRKSVV